MLSYAWTLSYFSIQRHNAFASGFDLGNMNQTVWNTANGNFFMLTTQQGNLSRLSIHADYVLILIAPLYWIWDNVRVLLILEAIFIAVGAIPVFLIAQHLLKNRLISLGFSVLYLINPGLQWAIIYDFHSVSFALPMLLFCGYFILKKQWKWYVLFAFLAILAKENVSLTVSAMGIVIFFYSKQKRIGLISMFVGVLYFVITVFVIMPAFSLDNQHWALSWFRHTSQSSSAQYMPPPEFIMNRLFQDAQTKEYFYMMFRQWGGLPILGLPWLIISLPDLLINVFSAQGQMRSIYFHYDVIIAAGMIISAIFGIYYVQILTYRFTKSYKISKLISYVFFVGGLVIGLHFSYYYIPLPLAPGCLCYIYNVSEDDRRFTQLLRTIPQSASVTASPEIRPHVTRRELSYTLPVATDSADYIALIDQNRMVGNYEPKDFELRLIEILEREERYEKVEQFGHFSLYRKKKR